ncbi:Maf family nucleotide pyrophosphatase [Tepidiphilus sp. J10]|uniref:Maf family nucleotide pyrophosphatase n=1 Tax=Tepidiphilus sp. J10 TaxID=2502185 RepID=UPI00115D2D8C|nr:Maf family nucleotide pyrophosphatase [Tepidiphilus sp. J10]
MTRLILASTSPYRRQLLERFGLPFAALAPQVDETPLPGEPPARTARRLAEAKARAVAATLDEACHVIGSDQVAHLGDERFGKPGSVERAVAQLQRMRGRTVEFSTAVCVLDEQGRAQTELVPTRVRFRADLTDAELVRYVERERPLDCAGSAKAEGLGIALLEVIESSDPTALIGLPLIATARMLRRLGWTLP